MNNTKKFQTSGNANRCIQEVIYTCESRDGIEFKYVPGQFAAINWYSRSKFNGVGSWTPVVTRMSQIVDTMRKYPTTAKVTLKPQFS